MERRFLSVLGEFTGGNEDLEYGVGRWLEMVRGKMVLPFVLRACFKVRDAQGAIVQNGRDCLVAVAKDLLRKGLDVQPGDFQRLYRVIEDRVISA